MNIEETHTYFGGLSEFTEGFLLFKLCQGNTFFPHVDFESGLRIIDSLTFISHKYMNEPHDSFLTQEKFEELKKELDHLKTVRRKEVAESLEYARSLGDISENAEYQEARDMQGAIEERIQYLEKVIKEAKIVANVNKGDVVGLGSVVTIQKDGNTDSRKYTIVGSDEANIHEHKLSYLSPLGEALMGKAKGDAFTFDTPAGKQAYAVLKVE